MTSESEKLKACLHCGEARFAKVRPYPWEKYGEDDLQWGFHVICDASGLDSVPRGCGASSGWGETEAEAIAAWNRRSPEGYDVATLEWEDFIGRAFADSIVGRYQVWFDGRECRASLRPYLSPGHVDTWFGHSSSLDEAKAAAEADYRQRILPALRPRQGTAPAVGGEPFQSRVAPWMQACFGPEISSDRLERGDRLLEEVLELLQSGDYPRERVAALTNYTYSRDKGTPHQEAGGERMVVRLRQILAEHADEDDADLLARIEGELTGAEAQQIAKLVADRDSAMAAGAMLGASPVRGQILLCNFDLGRVPPEMRKTRRVVVMSPSRYNHPGGPQIFGKPTKPGKVVVVPLSATEPKLDQPTHVPIPKGRYQSLSEDVWAICEMVDHVSHARLSRVLVGGKWLMERITAEDMAAIEEALRHAIGIPTPPPTKA